TPSTAFLQFTAGRPAFTDRPAPLQCGPLRPPRRRTSRLPSPRTREALAVALPIFLSRLLVRTGAARLLPSVRRLTDGGADYLHSSSYRLLAAPHAARRDLAPLLEPHAADVMDLAQGSPRFDLVPSGSTKLPADRRGWPPPWGLPELREAVAGKLHIDQQLDVNPTDEVLITHGAAGAFNVVLDTFVNRGDHVVLFDPTSPLYGFALRYRRAHVRWIPTWTEAGRLRFHLEAMVKALRGAKLIVVTSPANPTGCTIAAEDLEQLVGWADRRDVLLVNDEVFERYGYDGARSSLATFPRAQRRTLTLGSISKGHALASARVGWVAGHRHLVRPCAL